MAESGDPHSPQDGAPQGPNHDDLFRDETPSAPQPSQRPTWAAPVRPAPDAAPDPHAHDDLIGFTSPASLAGTGRPAPAPPAPPELEPEPEPEIAPEAASPQPVIPPAPQPDPLVLAPRFETPKPAPRAVETPKPSPKPSPAPAPSWSVETPLDARPAAGPAGRPAFGRGETARAAAAAPEGATGLYTIYALILFAVPTFGVAAAIGLFMVWTKARPQQSLALSHFEFQKRTLWIAAIAAVVGVVLIAVNLGVFVLFLMAVWVIVRGAWGIMTLAAGKPVLNPRTWLI